MQHEPSRDWLCRTPPEYGGIEYGGLPVTSLCSSDESDRSPPILVGLVCVFIRNFLVGRSYPALTGEKSGEALT